MKITREDVSGIARTLLAPNYENPVPTPSFHEDLWELCCSDYKKIAIAAPRGHAKTTAITGAYLLTTLLCRERRYALVISDTEDQAAEFLGEIKRELLDNDLLRETYEVDRLIRDQNNDIICRLKDGHVFRVIAKGAEQKIRGRKYRGTRPDIIVCHERGTRVYADGKWIINDNHPTAKVWEADGIGVYVEGDPTPERVSTCHRYWVKRTENAIPEWVEAKDLKTGMFIGDAREAN